jgi:NET1-associated nuclear protein 1 (U3 small nucleolar RNA-associated protein 17)
LTISPSGTSYGIQLAHNSIMVLSTAELQPKTHIAGLQSLCISTSYIRTNNGLLSSAKDAYAAIPLVSNPRSSKDFLLAVPVNQQITKTTTLALPAPFLQTYDLQAGRHVSRQALTRNLVTETNIDPDWNKIEIPNVTLMQISHDGNWLATVEEWTPPTHTLQHLASNKHDVEVERRKRRETYLKIWHWNEESNTWALNTRVDKPHADESHEEANRTFHLVAHPTRAGFATIGEDSAIRIWRPRKRDAETMWHAKSVFRLERSAATADETSDFPLPSIPIIGCLAYSNDGSVLAVSTQNNVQRQSRVVQLLNAETGEVRFAENGLAVGHVVSMGFLDRYLIILSDELRVWDLVIGNMVFARALSGTRMSLSQRLATTHLAISTRSATFAVAGFDIVEGHSGSTVLVFKPTTTEPIYRFDLNYGAVSALASLLDTGGYVVLNSLAEIRTLITHNVPITGKLPKAIIKAKAENQVAELEDEEMEEVKEATATRAERRAPTLALENDRQVLKSEQLAQVFATGSAGFGLPSVKEMFDGVAKLFTVKAE